MTGRGKGGKGLGKGGAKRHRKVLRDNIQGMNLKFNIKLIYSNFKPPLCAICCNWMILLAWHGGQIKFLLETEKNPAKLSRVFLLVLIVNCFVACLARNIFFVLFKYFYSILGCSISRHLFQKLTNSQST